MGSIPAIPNAQTVPLLLCHERFNEASLPDDSSLPNFVTSDLLNDLIWSRDLTLTITARL